LTAANNLPVDTPPFPLNTTFKYNSADAWLSEEGGDPDFPRFESVIPGGITAWYTMRLTALGENRENAFELDLPSAIRLYEERDAQRCIKWQEKFSLLSPKS